MKRANRLLLICLLTVGLFVWNVPAWAQTVSSQTNGPGNGLRVSPIRNELTLDPGKSQTVSLFVENLANTPVNLKPVVNDFVASDQENGEPKLLLDENSTAPVNSFKGLVKGPLANINLNPNERKEVKVTVAVPAGSPAGGYYGAVRFAPVSSTGQSTNVALTASVGSLFLVRVNGNVVEKLQVASFKVLKGGKAGTFFNPGNFSVETRFVNQGNIHVQPFGKVTIKDTWGKTIETEEVNNSDPRGNILPGSVRKFITPIKKNHLLGRYTVEGSFGYGTDGTLLESRVTFYVIPYVWIVIILLVVALLVFGLPRLIKAYNQSVIRKSRR